MKILRIIRTRIQEGINYFDTAYIYNDGDSEKCLGEAMKVFPRDSYYIATKFYIDAITDYEAVFEEQLRRLQTDKIDFYLLHCIVDGKWTLAGTSKIQSEGKPSDCIGCGACTRHCP